MSVSGNFSFCNENGNKTCQTYITPKAEAENLLKRILNDYISTAVDPSANFSTVSIGGFTTYSFSYSLPGSIDVVITVDETSGPVYNGSINETPGASTTIIFTGNTSSFVDSSGDNYTITINTNQFVLNNTTDGWSFDSSTSIVSPL